MIICHQVVGRKNVVFPSHDLEELLVRKGELNEYAISG